MEKMGQLVSRDIAAAAIHQVVKRKIISRNLRVDKYPFRGRKAGGRVEGIQKRILHAHGVVSREDVVLHIEEVGERVDGGAAQWVKDRGMKIELQEKFVARTGIREIIGRTVGVVSRRCDHCRVHCRRLWDIPRIGGWRTRQCPLNGDRRATIDGIVRGGGSIGHRRRRMKHREVLDILCVCKGHNLSAHGSVHRVRALSIDRLKDEGR